MPNLFKIRRALVSVSDKENLISLAKELVKYDIEIIASSGTQKSLNEYGIKSTFIQEVTGNPEAFSGRMKTMSFEISSSLLYRRDSKEDVDQAKELGILPIDLVVCNLYPFEETAKTSSSLDELVEKIDIGGPCMIRSAAKNFSSVATICSTSDYAHLIKELNDNDGSTSLNFRKFMSAKAFAHTSQYESVIVDKLTPLLTDNRAPSISFNGELKQLRYGENPHQRGTFIGDTSQWTPIQGKELSYNNILDGDAAYRCLVDLDNEFSTKKACVIVKHSNPCGASVCDLELDALTNAWASDPISAFGGILCFNFTVDVEIANWLSDKFIEFVIAPKYTDEALEVFRKKKNLRLLCKEVNSNHLSEEMVRSVCGGVLVQDEDGEFSQEIEFVTENTNIEKDISRFGIILTKHFKSNAISLVEKKKSGLTLLGAGMGNPNRLISTTQAFDKARENGIADFSNTILISDAFFPFRDNVDLASEYGIKGIIQPGGSIKDKDVISACKEHGISMGLTGMRHFRH